MKKLSFFICLCDIVVGMVSCGYIQEEPQNVVNEVTIYGNVIDRATGQSLYNVLIQEKNKVGGSTVTGNDGNYEFTLPLNGSSDGKYYLVASKDKYSSSEYELEMSKVDKNRRVKVDFQLGKNAITYEGRVIDSNGIPLAGVSVEECNYSMGTSYTDSNGQYKLEVPPYYSYTSWKYQIKASKTGYISEYQHYSHSLNDLGKIISLNFTLTKDAITIKGRVTNRVGQPVANATISAWAEGYGDARNKGKLQTTAYTNSDGEYELTTVPSADGHAVAYHTFECKASGYMSETQTLYTDYEDAGKSYNVDFILKPIN